MAGPEDYAAEPGLTRLLDAAARRYRELSRVGGTVRVERLTAAEARALAHLAVTGRTLPRDGADVTVELARLDGALTEAGGLLAVLRAAGHDVTTTTEQRRIEGAKRDAAWQALHDLAADRRTEAWLGWLRARRGGAPPAALATTLAALALLDTTRAGWDRARLATEVAGDPHALDEKTPAGAWLLAALAYRDGTAVPPEAAARRALMARHGIVSDPHSSTVLVLGLRTTGTGPAAAALRAADGGHAVLTLAQLEASALTRLGGGVRTCEGPVVVRAAEDRLGGAADSRLVCTDGQPSAACDALLRQIGASVRHSGDFEWGGLRIASVMHRRYGARPWRHGVTDYDAAVARLPGRAVALDAPRGDAPEGVESLWRRLERCRVPVWQEDLLDVLIGDLA